MSLATSQYQPAAFSRRELWWSRLRWPLGMLGLALTLILVLFLFNPFEIHRPYSTSNPLPAGTRAMAQVLRDQGVDVHEATSVAAAEQLLRKGDATLVVVDDAWLSQDQVVQLASLAKRTVLVDPAQGVLDQLLPGIRADGSQYVGNSASPGEQCSAPAAHAAGNINIHYASFRLTTSDAKHSLCFLDDHHERAFLAQDRTGRVTAVTSIDFVINYQLPQAGNAALGFWLTGSQPNLVWLLPEPPSGSTQSTPEANPAKIIPPWAMTIFWVLLVSVAFLALWRIRGFGRPVGEPLPVIALHNETLDGRGSLYRKSRDYDHAVAGLRAGFAHRIAPRVGLLPSDNLDTTVQAIASYTGVSDLLVRELLAGPGPQTQDDFVQFTKNLTALEQKVTRK